MKCKEQKCDCHEAKARDSLLGTENPVVSRRLLQLVTVPKQRLGRGHSDLVCGTHLADPMECTVQS